MIQGEVVSVVDITPREFRLAPIQVLGNYEVVEHFPEPQEQKEPEVETYDVKVRVNTREGFAFPKESRGVVVLTVEEYERMLAHLMLKE